MSPSTVSGSNGSYLSSRRKYDSDDRSVHCWAWQLGHCKDLRQQALLQTISLLLAGEIPAARDLLMASRDPGGFD